MVAVEFRLLLFLALMPVVEPWDPWEGAKPTLPVRNVWAAAKPACASFFPSPFSFSFFFVLFYDPGFPEHPAWPLQLLESKRRRRTVTHDGSMLVHVAHRPGCKV